MASNFPSSVDVFKTIPTPTTTPTNQADASNDTLSTRLQQHSDAVVAVETYLINKSYYPDIYSIRQRSFNAVGNPNFEVIARNGGLFQNNLVGFIEDRWSIAKTGTMTHSAQVTNAGFPGVGIPGGTNFIITNKILRITVTGQQTVLGIGDNFSLYQGVEGPCLRPLAQDVHSLSLLVRSSVAGLTFGANLQDPNSTTALSKLCTIPTAGVFTLIPLSSLPAFPTGSSFSTLPGNLGYWLNITLAAGTNFMPSANDIWVSGNRTGALGQSNFFASPVGSTFEVAFIQHESGPASQLMDKPLFQNIAESSRYFCKSYDFLTAPGTANTQNGLFDFVKGAGSYFLGAIRFPMTMAKVPTVTIYNYVSGAANSVQGNVGALTVGSVTGRGTGGFDEFTVSTIGANTECYAHYTADTGW